MINFMGLFIAIIFMLFFWYLFKWSYLFGLNGKNLNLENKSFIIFAFIGGLLCYYLIAQDRTIYINHYWAYTYRQMKILFTDPLIAMLRLGGSIFFADYNSILPTLAVLPLKMFGYTYLRYILVLYGLFFLPAVFIIYTLMKKISGSGYNKYIMLFLIFTFTPFYPAILAGFPDIACLIPASIALLMIKDYDALLFTREQIKRDIYISGMLLCTILFRRYFAFHVEGFMTALACLSIYDVVKSKKYSLLKNAVLNIIVIGLFALVIMIVFFAPMLYRILRTNYANIYAAWDAPLLQKILGIVNHVGYFTLIFAAMGVILPLFTKRMRRYSLFCAISFVVTTILFFRVQAMDLHHFLTITPQLLILSYIGIIQTCDIFSGAKKIIYCACIVIIAANFANCFFPDSRPFLSPASKIFTNVYNSSKRDDIPVLNEIADYLNALTKGTDKKIYMLTSAENIINKDIMDALKKPFIEYPVKNLARTEGIDLRNGFPVELLYSDILVTTNKETSKEHVITFPLNELKKSDSPFGRHFRKIEKEFTLDNGVKVYFHEKTSDFTQEDLQYIADYFTRIYPGYEAIFANRILNHTDIWDSQAQLWSPSVVAIIRWIAKNNLLTPEQLAAATNKNVEDIKFLYQNN